jgi:hypothetical protein
VFPFLIKSVRPRKDPTATRLRGKRSNGDSIPTQARED